MSAVRTPARLPRGHKVNIGWSSNGQRHIGTCWTNQVDSFLAKRIASGSKDIVLVVQGGRRYDLGDKP